MKKMKRVTCVVLALLLSMSMLTACGNDKKATQGADGEVFKIGGIGPTTGDAAIYGIAVKNAAQIAVDEINEAGGANGYKFELNFQDDQSDEEKAINAYNALKDWGTQMIVGAVTSAPCIAVVEKTFEDNMFQITPSATAVESVQHPNAFRVCFSDPNQGEGSAQYIGEHKLAEKIAIIYDSSGVYSSGIYESFIKEAANYDFEIVATEAFTSDSNTDFTVQLQKAKESGADLVFLPIYYKEASLILTQANSMGFTPNFFGVDGMDGILTMKNFDLSLAENVMLLTPFAADATDDLTVKFVTSYKEKFTDTPNQFAADAYDAVYAIKAAIEHSKATPDMSVSEICEALKAAMVEIKVDGLTGDDMSWTVEGEPSKAPRAVKIQNGVYVAM